MIKKIVTTGKTLVGIAAFVGLGVIAAPAAYEGYHSDQQRDHMDAATQKIVQEKFFICDPAAASYAETTRAEVLSDIMAQATGNALPAWNHPIEMYFNGIKRLKSKTPFFNDASEKTVVSETLPEDATPGVFSTPFDDMSEKLQNMAKLGIGVCFDSGLEKANLGSAFIAEQGLIVVNPQLPAPALAAHIQRHIEKIDQDIVKPYERLVAKGNEERAPFSDRVEQLEIFVGTLKDGKVTGLPTEGDALVTDFISVDAKVYKSAPLLQQKPETAPAAAAPKPKK